MKKLKLTNLAGLNIEEIRSVTGGQIPQDGKLCGCGCKYEGNGGSSTADNGVANCKEGLRSRI